MHQCEQQRRAMRISLCGRFAGNSATTDVDTVKDSVRQSNRLVWLVLVATAVAGMCVQAKAANNDDDVTR